MDNWDQTEIDDLLLALNMLADYIPTVGILLGAIAIAISFVGGMLMWRNFILAVCAKGLLTIAAALWLSQSSAFAAYESMAGVTKVSPNFTPGHDVDSFDLGDMTINSVTLFGWGENVDYLAIWVGVTIPSGSLNHDHEYFLVGLFKKGESQMCEVAVVHFAGDSGSPANGWNTAQFDIDSYIEWDDGGHEIWCQALYQSWGAITVVDGTSPCTYGSGNGARNTIGYCVDVSQDSGDITKWAATILHPTANNLCPSQAGSTNSCTSHCSTGPCVDTDGDGTCDPFDPDDDSDGVPDECDKDPKVYHSGNIDYDCEAPGCCEANESYCGPCVADPPDDPCVAPKSTNPETGLCECPEGMVENEYGECYCAPGSQWNDAMQECSCLDADGDNCCDAVDKYPNDSTKGCQADPDCECSFDWQTALDNLLYSLAGQKFNATALGAGLQQDLNLEFPLKIGPSAGDIYHVYLHTKFDTVGGTFGPLMEGARIAIRAIIAIALAVYTLRCILKVCARY